MDPLDQLYQQIILEHARLRKGADLGAVPLDDSVPHGQIQQFNPTCGDEVTVRVEVRDGAISAIHWSGSGCSISQAATSVLSDMAPGMSVADFQALIDDYREMLRSRGTIRANEAVLGDAAAFEGVSKYSSRVKCAMLGWVAAEAAAREAAHGGG